MANSQEQLSELLSAYIDGEVTPREKAQVEEILLRDAGARSLLDELRQTSAMIAGLPRHGAPPDLATNLDAQLERKQLLSGLGEIHSGRAPVAPSRFTWLKAAAMLAFVAGGGWWFLSIQQSRTNLVAMKEAAQPKETEATSLNAISTPPRHAEDLLASGANPSVLLTQSFELEPLRVQVIARNESERDEIKHKLSSQFAQARAENLATRAAAANTDRQVGAFYLEGKPGVNFSDPKKRQILVRLPQSQADQLIDSVTAGGQVSDNQISLQVGPAVVQGPDKARAMLQMMASRDTKPADAPAESESKRSRRAKPTAENGERGKPEGLLKTLSDIVGVTPATEERGPAAPAEPEMADSAKPEALDSTLAAGTIENKETTADPTMPLVSRRWEAARSRTGNEVVGPGDRSMDAAPPAAPMMRASASGPADPYITIVIDLGIASPNPPSRNGNNHPRS